MYLKLYVIICQNQGDAMNTHDIQEINGNAILDKINQNDGGEIDKGFIMPI